MVYKCSLVERLDLLPMAVLLMIGGKLPAQRAKSAHFVGHLPTNPGRTARSTTSTRHIFSKPDPAVGSNIDPNTHQVQGSTEQVDPVPSSKRLVSHAFLNGGDASPGCRIRPCHGDILSTVAIPGKPFIRDALVRRTAIWARMAKAAVIHIPAMEK